MKTKILVVACLTSLTGSTFAFALGQQQAPFPVGQANTSETAPAIAVAWPSPEATVAKMSSQLNLTDDQKAKTPPVIADRQTQMKALMADPPSRRMQKARKAKSILSDSDKKIEAVLTSGQKKTYAEMKEQMKEQLQARMQQRNSGSLQ